MSADPVILKVKGRYYHRHLGDSFDVHLVAPGVYSSGYFKDSGGSMLSLCNEMGRYQGRIRTDKLIAVSKNGATLWDADGAEKQSVVDQKCFNFVCLETAITAGCRPANEP